MVITLNKQEENITDIITLDAIEDITDIFLQHAANTEDIVGLIANKELIEYVMNEALSEDWIYLLKINLEADDDMEYMISIEPDGCLIVQPIESYEDKYFTNIKYAFVSMDEDISQITIDNLLDRDIPIVLFGYDEENDYKDNYTVNGKSVSKNEFDEFISKFKKTTYDNNFTNASTVVKSIVLSNTKDVIENIEHINEMLDEMNRFRDLFRW